MDRGIVVLSPAEGPSPWPEAVAYILNDCSWRAPGIFHHLLKPSLGKTVNTLFSKYSPGIEEQRPDCLFHAEFLARF
jgi:hypothetical protein